MTTTSNKTQWFVIAGLALVLLAGTIAASGKKEEKKKEEKAQAEAVARARAVILPAGDGVGRRVVVPPCRTSLDTVQDDAEKGKITTGALILRGGGGDVARTVLIPDCNVESGAATDDGSLSAAAFILPIGAEGTGSPDLKVTAEGLIRVPEGGEARTIVVLPCASREGEGKARANAGEEVVAEGDGDTFVAPGC